LFGASNDDALPLKAGYALQWSIILGLRGTSARWYDLGGEAGEPGLSQFKRGLVGRHGVVISAAGEYEYLPTWRAQLASGIVMGLREVRRRISTIRSGLQ
jgi:lipid II:glycine glycyltransferase (peptidoglycan interpeptide bridge formation enzyme)